MLRKIYRAIGLMSGTSMDGIDLSLIESDGEKIIRHVGFDYLPYQESFKQKLRKVIYDRPDLIEIKNLENEMTIMHAVMVNDFLAKNQIKSSEIDLISFHGHTILHKPELGITWQLGNSQLLACKTKIGVIGNLRVKDVVLGGQGAPLVPIYHFHLFPESGVVLNIGGISNITSFIKEDESSIEAFDICFGNAPLDDLVKKKLGTDFDRDGEISLQGKPDLILAEYILQNEIFHKKPPKSFDRDDYASIITPINNLKIEDALATFAYIHAKAVDINLNFLKNRPKKIFVCGGGRKNKALIQWMKKELLNIEVKITEEIGFNGDTIEAEAFAFLGIRSLLKLPISFHSTTGVKNSSDLQIKNYSASGGVFYPS
jgi:anhydro-N-acetylmuramic acid kinase